MNLRFFLILCFIFCLFGFDVSFGRSSKSWDELDSREKRSALIESVYEVTRPSFRRKAGFTLRSDCSGLIEAMFFDLGLNLGQFSQNYGVKGNGVAKIFDFIARVGSLSISQPATGDLVFFSNTFDRNRDGQWNDKLTHIGVVKSVDALGTITFLDLRKGRIHSNKLNLQFPAHYSYNGQVVNSHLRRTSQNLGLASKLFEGFGSVLPES